MAILAMHVKVSEAAAFLTKNKTLQLIWDQFSWQLTTILWAAHFKLRLVKSNLIAPRGSDSPVYAHFGRTHQKLKSQTYGCLANYRNFNSNIYSQFLQQLTTILWAAHFKLRLAKSVLITPRGSDLSVVRPFWAYTSKTENLNVRLPR